MYVKIRSIDLSFTNRRYTLLTAAVGAEVTGVGPAGLTGAGVGAFVGC